MFERLLKRVACRGAQVRAGLVPFALGGIVLVGAIARFWGLGASALNFDESYTAMVGRLPLRSAFTFLRGHDSHPPLDYLLQLPLARAAVSPFVFRLPAALCSIGALALFAWWMRDRGRVGIVATAAMSICAFQLIHGREARMYAPLELIGVGVAVVADSWLRAPRRRHAAMICVLVFVGLMTHISTILLAIGLIALAGRRRDVNAWQWRAAIAAGTAGWALLWGRSFLVQARGGHSSWIDHTTPARFVDTIGALVADLPGISAPIVAAIVVGIIVCRHRDRPLAMVLACCFVIPAALAGLFGLWAPVLLDRTLTLASWGPLLALGYFVDALSRRARILGVVGAASVAVAILASVPHALHERGSTALIAQLERVVRPGDVVAIQPSPMGVELDWSFGVRSDDGPARAIHLPGMRRTVALALVGGHPSGRIWLMQITPSASNLRHYARCAPTRHYRAARLLCLRYPFPAQFMRTSSPTVTAIFPDRPALSSRRHDPS
ncbi:MAG: mannosyltransferase [Actinomycetota bacterium]|nr:mannosyltransferase [Actinomycetota bacterium]